MKIVQTATKRPVGVAVGVILIVMFGLLALVRIPIQLTPDVRKPKITVETRWPGSSPNEVEQEITIPQEDMLKSIPGLTTMESDSYNNRTKIVLEFEPGTDMDSALVLVSNRLQRIKNYPEEASRPTLKTADSDASPITWIQFHKLDPNDLGEVYQELDFVEDVVQTAIERVPGVALVNVFGGRKRELRVTVDPSLIAARGLTVGEIAAALKRENVTISAGALDEGKRSYLVRTVGKLETPERIRDVVIKKGDGGRVTVGDIASSVDFAFQDATVNVRIQGKPALAINAVRESQANVLEIMDGIRDTLDELNRDVLKARGLHLKLLYDQTDYIYSAIQLVRQNLIIGGILAMIVLLVFLRSIPATMIVAVAIPVALIGAFLAMAAVGRTINVVSLAGLAFAVGMVVDPAIVVLENIVRLNTKGIPRFRAAVQGAGQVWGAILISTVTTVAVFLPILTLKIEAAQLFGDIAVALSSAVLFSLLISTTVIPSMATRWIRRSKREIERSKTQTNENREGPLTRALGNFTRRVTRSLAVRLLVIVGLIGGAAMTTWSLLPPAEYLPTGNRNLVFAMLIPPPGYNLEEMTEMAEGVEKQLLPHIRAPEEPPPEDGHATIKHFFFAARGAVAFFGGAATEPSRVKEILPLIQGPARSIPGTFGIVNQTSIFARGIGRGRSIDIAITGPDLKKDIGLAKKLFGMTLGALDGPQIRPIPGLELGNPEVRLVPDLARARDLDISTNQIGQAVDAFTSGFKVDDLVLDGREIDLMLRGTPELLARTQDVGQLPLATPGGRVVPVSTVAKITPLDGPVQIKHLERERSITLRVTPPADMPMEIAIDTIQKKVIDPVVAGGLPPLTKVRMTEGADQLLLAKEALSGQFLLALAITFLLMAALFESFLYPLVIIVTVPLATAGGMLGLKVLNFIQHQPMDVLTMLGFVILIGVVVNNAILIVHQALNFIREERMSPNDAVVESVKIRVRPIFMSTLTSIFGMAPLVLFPGAGSELYRGLGSVVIGGLLVSTVFTLVLVPALFSLMMGIKLRFGGVRKI